VQRRRADQVKTSAAPQIADTAMAAAAAKAACPIPRAICLAEANMAAHPSFAKGYPILAQGQ
jgi:hypothetical protein